MAFTYLKVKSAKCLLFTSGVLGLVILVLVLRIWSCLHHCQTPYLVGLAIPSREIQYKVHRAFGLDFRPFGPHSAASSNSLHFPDCIRVLIKTLVVPIFGAKECIRMQDLVLKIYQKIPGSRLPDPHSRRGDICSHPPPCPPARCWQCNF